MLLRFGGGALANLVGSFATQLIAALTGFLNSVDSAVEASIPAGEALSSLLDIWATLAAKYDDVIQNLQSAETQQDCIAVGNVSSAQLAWNELTVYATSLLSAPSSTGNAEAAMGMAAVPGT